MTDKKRNPVGWFEIPTIDLDRAQKFYETVFEMTMERHEMGALQMAWFPAEQDVPGATGTLVKMDEGYAPSDKAGVLIYFTAHSGDLNNELSRVEAAGGTVLQEKKSIGEHGFVAFFLDSEGNRIAIHSIN